MGIAEHHAVECNPARDEHLLPKRDAIETSLSRGTPSVGSPTSAPA
jgi:hypothetical protein